MKLARYLAVFIVCALLAGVLPAGQSRPAHAQANGQTGSWYRYQGEPSSYDSYGNQRVNCGPTSVAMAIQHSRNLSVPIKDIRTFIGRNRAAGNNGYTYHSDITRSLSKWGVKHQSNIVNAQDIREVLKRGNIALINLDMRKISPGVDVGGRSADPTLRTGRYDSFAAPHWIVVKGVTSDARYFVVYDGNVWGGPGNRRYWYSDGTPKGIDRLYLASEVQAAMVANSSPTSIKGVEILGGTRPPVETGRKQNATITFFTASFEETRKRPGDPGWGIMRNGNMVHWGAVAVDPEYIPLGTRMYIEGYGDQVFVAEDTGNLVKGWHVDIFWPGTREEAFRQNDLKGGPNKTITLLGPGPVFTDQAPPTSTAPTVSNIKVVQDPDTSGSRWVTLNIDARDAEEKVVGMMFSNNPHFTDGFEEPYAETKQWTLLPGDGEKTVYTRFKNESGAWSDVVSTKVKLEERPPVGSVIVAPDPRVLLNANLSGNTMANIGREAKTEGQLQYRPLGPNMLRNSSFEAWAGGIPDGWDTQLRHEARDVYEPKTGAYHGALALMSASREDEPEGRLTQKVILKPSTLYTLSAWAKGNSGKLEVQELQTQGVASKPLQLHTATSESTSHWKQLSLSFQSGPTATDATVSLSGYEVYWDALQLEEGRSASAYRADGVLLEGPARNYVPNSSIELGEQGWSGLNAWVKVVASPDYARYGGKGLMVTKAKEGNAATVSPVTTLPGKPYTYSVYVRLQDGKPVTNDLLSGWYYEGTDDPDEVDVPALTDKNRPAMRWEAVGGGWYRGYYTIQPTEKIGLYGIYSSGEMPVGGVYYLDGAQMESGKHVSSYIDGSLGTGYQWEGEPFASGSLRERASVTYGRTRGKQGSLLYWARAEGGAPVGATLLQLGEYTHIRLRGAWAVLQIRGKEIARAPWKPGVAQAYGVTWDGETVSFYQGGGLMGSANAGGPEPGAELTLGPAKGPAYPNAVVGDVSLWTDPLTPAEVAYLAAHAPLDAGLLSVNDRNTTVATSALDGTESEVRAEWSKDGETWHRWDKARGLHPWDLGGGEGMKTVWVRFTDREGNWLAYSDTIVLDRTPPRVGGARLMGSVLTVTFSEPVSADSLSEVSVTSDGEPTAGRWSYTPGSVEATYTITSRVSAPLDLAIPATVRDLAGNELGSGYEKRLPLAPSPAGRP
ncbi:MAG: 3D domain-containing protein [Chloroflexota bacterium]|nr:3D domain-containing protein [Chloroflexota bacterium]